MGLSNPATSVSLQWLRKLWAKVATPNRSATRVTRITDAVSVAKNRSWNVSTRDKAILKAVATVDQQSTAPNPNSKAR